MAEDKFIYSKINKIIIYTQLKLETNVNENNNLS